MTVINWTERPLPQPGTYHGTVVDVTDVDGQFGPQLQLTFDLARRDGTPAGQIKAWVNPKLNPKSKLYAWSHVLLEDEMPRPGEPLDTRMLVGRSCYVKISETPGPSGDVRVKVETLYPVVPF